MNTYNSTAKQYENALDFLYGHMNFEVKAQDRYMANKLDSTRPFRLMSALDNPHQQYPSIHIAGTKGKGSIAAICASVLREAGLRVGLYTSPHLQDFRERIRVLTPADADGRIPKLNFVQLMEEMKTAVAQVEDSTWFEIVSSLAFLHFARQQIDIAIIEVGLGGRLDSTNVVTPLVSVISSLSLDHTNFLGNTIEKIAYEKGGIIKPFVPVITAVQPPKAMERLESIARERNSPLTAVGLDWLYERKGQHRSYPQTICITKAPLTPLCPPNTCFPLALRGAHQLENSTIALAALAAVQPHFPSLTVDAVRDGFANVQWNGRLQQLQSDPIILTDGAHNADSVQKLTEALRDEFEYGRLHLIFAVSGDKNIAEMIDILFPMAASIIVTRSTHPRAAVPIVLAEQAAGYPVTAAENLEEALTAVLAMADKNDLICVTGSLFIVGDLLNILG